MFAELETGRADGRYPRLFRALAKVNLLILDDWGPDRLSADQRRDLMDIVEDRYQNTAILITSQLPVDKWHDVIGEPTFADAILDRIVHNAHRINLDGPSMRKTIAENFNATTLTTPNENDIKGSAQRRRARHQIRPPAKVAGLNRNQWPLSSECAKNCHIVNIRGNSYRMKDHQNLLQSGSDRRRKRAAA